MPKIDAQIDKEEKQKKDGNEEAEEEEEEEDYMSMIIQEPHKPKDKETSIQRRARKEREAEINSRAKTLQDRKTDEAAEQGKAFDSKIDASNKGFKMLAKLGYKAGEGLGKSAQARTEPIRPVVKENRGGIGLEAEKKRKLREEMEVEAKKVKTEQGDYRERMRLEREERRLEAQVTAAQKVAEKRDTEAEESDNATKVEGGDGSQPRHFASDVSSKPLKSTNVLWRGLLRLKLQLEQDRRRRHDLQQSLSRLPTYEDPDEDEDDKKALGQAEMRSTFEEEVEEEDAELEEFEALPPRDRLEKLVFYLRDTYLYCFWCKYQYADKTMEDCPGITEEDHD